MENRKKEILSQMASFGKEAYLHEEILPELLKLQDEMVEITFNKDHAELAGLKISNVWFHLRDLNNEKKRISDERMEAFDKQCYELSNEIRAYISGNRGEEIVYRRLENLYGERIILRNIELGSDLHTELDAVVIMPKGVYIVEVKNTRKNVQIDENGDMYYLGEYNRFDGNMLEKMQTKETVLQEALQRSGVENVPIKSVLVFTDRNNQAHNECKEFMTCKLPTLNRTIGSDFGGANLSGEDMQRLATIIKDSVVPRSYPAEMNIGQLKNDFAEIIADLERENDPDVAANVSTLKVVKTQRGRRVNKRKVGVALRALSGAAEIAAMICMVMAVTKKTA